MKPFRRRHGSASRGQALVELAIMLPVLILVLMLAIDFGRVFFGWVGLNNAVRIAANEAGFNPQAWNDPVWVELQDVYRDQVAQDMEAINCGPTGGGSWDAADVPNPTFINQAGTPTTDPHEVGDHAQVRMTCNFTFLTPLVGGIFGDPMPITALAEFPVKGGKINDVPVLPEASASPPAEEEDQCEVPELFHGLRVNEAPAVYNGLAGFSGAVIPQRPPNGNYLIGSQDLVGGSLIDCDIPIHVQPQP
jgi:hypothetical protein